MTEVFRSYSAIPGARGRRSRRGKHQGRSVALAVLALVLLWMVWATRDSEPVTGFIPADQAYQLYAGDIIKKRAEIAQSSVWDLLPQDSPVQALREQLSGSLGMPDWVLNNLVYDVLHVSGKDVVGFGDALIVTHMSRAGCFIEKFQRFVPGIDNDFAGGLELRQVPEAGMYYAVRGRVLLLSPSRPAIIHALTLAASEALPKDQLRTGLTEMAGGEDISGSIRLPKDHPLGEVCESLRFALRVDPAQIRVNCHGVLRPAWRDRLSGLLEGATPRELKTPPEGLLVLSADFGKPLNTVAGGVGQALGKDPAWLTTLLATSAGATDPSTAMLGAAQALLGKTGPGLRLCWNGIDQNEMLPAPELVLLADVDVPLAQEVLASLPAAPPEPAPDAEGWNIAPQYDAATGVVHIPLVGGPSLEPTIAVRGRDLLVSSSRTVAESFLAQTPSEEKLQTPGNLYLRLRPEPAMQALVDSAVQFAEFGLIRGQTPDSFRAWTAPYLAMAQRVDEVAALAAHDNGEVRLDLKLLMRKP
jgi:hypothetical protein